VGNAEGFLTAHPFSFACREDGGIGEKGGFAVANYVYLLACENGSLYAGVTTDPARRFLQHSGALAGGARCTRMRRPIRFAAVWQAPDRGAALALEARLKRLSHAQKRTIAAGGPPPAFDLTGYRRMALSHDGKELAMLFVCYPRCSTCKKAQAWLEANGIPCTVRDIKTDPPTEEELRDWRRRSGLPLKRFFNTSGQRYRALDLSKTLDGMSEEEQFALLASDGMLVRRPIAVTDEAVYVGFREPEWEPLKALSK